MSYSAATRVSKNASMLLFGTMIRMLLVFAFVVYVANYLGKDGYGKYALTQQLFELFLSLSATGFSILVTRESAKNIEWLSHSFLTVVAMAVALSICAGSFLCAAAQVAGYAPDTRVAIAIACLALVPATLSAVAEAAFVAFEKAEIVAAGIALEGLARIGLSFIALFVGYELYSLIVILVLTRWIQLVVYAVLLRRRLPHVELRLSARELWDMANIWRVFAAETWVATLYLSMDVLLLSLLIGETAVGLYDAAWKLIRFGPVIATCFTTAAFPYISKLYVNARETFQVVSEQSVKYILAGVFPAVLCIFIFADRIVHLLFTSEYYESGGVLRVLAWLLIPQFLNPFLSRVLYARGQQSRSLLVAVVGLVSFLSFAFFLIPKFGPTGAAITMVISSYAALSCYVAQAMTGTDRRPLVTIFLRQAAAATALFIALMLVKNSPLLLLALVGPVFYLALLVGLRIVSFDDVKLLQELR